MNVCTEGMDIRSPGSLIYIYYFIVIAFNPSRYYHHTYKTRSSGSVDGVFVPTLYLKLIIGDDADWLIY